MDPWRVVIFAMAVACGPCTAGVVDSSHQSGERYSTTVIPDRQPLIYVNTTLEDALTNYLGLPNGSNLTRANQLATKKGTAVVKLRQQFGGTEMYDSIIVAEINLNETLVFDVTSGGIVKNVTYQLPGSPKVTPSKALEITAKVFDIEDEDLERYSWNQQTRLVYYPTQNGTNLTLSYLVEFNIQRCKDPQPLSPHAVVDAVTKKVLLSWNGLAAQSLVSISGAGGNIGSWGLQRYTDLWVTQQPDGVTCTYTTPGLKVQNLRSATSGTFVDFNFTCVDATSTTKDAVNGGYSPLNDVVRHSNITLQMYMSYVGVSPTGSLPLLARVHYGTNYENSFWDGTQINVGDGGSNTYPLTSLEIIAHEYSHAFTGRFSGLQYRDQPGGINEAFSDMAGEAAKFYLSDTNNFLVGSQITKNGSPIRYMCDPTRDGKSIANASLFVTGMDPHYSSGPYNKAFCLLAKTAGWDTGTAFQIFAYANSVYWSQLTGFSTGACGVQKAATVNGLSAADVAAAFSAAGVKC